MAIRVFRKAVFLTAQQRQRLRRLKGRPIFNPDKRRLQAALRKNDCVVRMIVQALGASSKHRVGGAVLLKSLAGCERQPFHTDYDPQTMPATDKPYGVICALDEGTKFVTPSRTYLLNEGDVLCFDGDEVHAGAEYDAENTRVHLYMDVVGVQRASDRTWLVR